MAIDKDIWQKAKALFEIGKSLSEISNETGISRSSVSMRANNQKWDSGKLNSIATDKVNAINNLEKINTKIEQLPSGIEQEVVQKEVDDRLTIIKSITNLDKGALSLHNIILKKTLSKAMSGEMSEQEASRVVQSMGLSVDKVASRAGIGKEPVNQVNIQNNANAVADAKLEEIVRRVLSSDDENDIISQLEETC